MSRSRSRSRNSATWDMNTSSEQLRGCIMMNIQPPGHDASKAPTVGGVPSPANTPGVRVPTFKQVPHWSHRRDRARKVAHGTSGAALGPAWPRLWIRHWGWEVVPLWWHWWDLALGTASVSNIRFLVALANKHHQRVLEASGGALICLLTGWVTEGQ